MLKTEQIEGQINLHEPSLNVTTTTTTKASGYDDLWHILCIYKIVVTPVQFFAKPHKTVYNGRIKPYNNFSQNGRIKT